VNKELSKIKDAAFWAGGWAVLPGIIVHLCRYIAKLEKRIEELEKWFEKQEVRINDMEMHYE